MQPLHHVPAEPICKKLISDGTTQSLFKSPNEWLTQADGVQAVSQRPSTSAIAEVFASSFPFVCAKTPEVASGACTEPGVHVGEATLVSSPEHCPSREEPELEHSPVDDEAIRRSSLLMVDAGVEELDEEDDGLESVTEDEDTDKLELVVHPTKQEERVEDSNSKAAKGIVAPPVPEPPPFVKHIGDKLAELAERRAEHCAAAFAAVKFQANTKGRPNKLDRIDTAAAPFFPPSSPSLSCSTAVATSSPAQRVVVTQDQEDNTFLENAVREVAEQGRRAEASMEAAWAEYDGLSVLWNDEKQATCGIERMKSEVEKAQRGVRDACCVLKQKSAYAMKLRTLSVRRKACELLGEMLSDLKDVQKEVNLMRPLLKVCWEEVISPQVPEMSRADAVAPPPRPQNEEEALEQLRALGLIDRVQDPSTMLKLMLSHVGALKPNPYAAPSAEDHRRGRSMSRPRAKGEKKMFLCKKHKLACVVRRSGRKANADGSQGGGRAFLCCPLHSKDGGCGFQKWIGSRRRHRRSATRSVSRSRRRRI